MCCCLSDFVVRKGMILGMMLVVETIALMVGC
jgi:hypothetical protein